MATMRKPIPFERHGPGCAGESIRRRPDHTQEAGRPGLNAGFQDFYAGRFRLALWLLERHSRSGAQRARAALMLVLGNILLAGVTLLLALLVVMTLQATLLWVFWVCLSLTLIGALVSTIFALRSVGRLYHVGGGSAAAGPGIFFHSGEGNLPTTGFMQSADQFRQGFYQVTRQEMLDGAIAELFTQARRRVRQERWFRWARVTFALTLLLLTLTAFGKFLLLIF